MLEEPSTMRQFGEAGVGRGLNGISPLGGWPISTERCMSLVLRNADRRGDEILWNSTPKVRFIDG